MTKRHCDTGRIDCPHLPECVWECHYDNAMLEPMVRKIKPWPEIPADIAPVPESWQAVGQWMIGAIMGALVVIGVLFFFTGAWIWSLLI